MSAINDLIDQIEDLELRSRIQAEVDRMNKQKKFGLVFEKHLPECTPLYNIPVKVGSQVSVKGGKASDLYIVLRIDGDSALCQKKNSKERVTLPIDRLVCTAEFGDPIYPYLKPIDKVCHAPDRDLWHVLIEADNYHALQLLEYLYAGKVDCIYIDPPYNTGANDWKYNNNYVDKTDTYRHSKWLSMMEKRLKLAKKLMNPENSVLVITIDEKEYLHLGCLLEEMFPECSMQMVSITINPAGTKRDNLFSRSDEYAFIILMGRAHVIHPSDKRGETEVEWWHLRRGDYSSRRGTVKGGPAQFYPIYVDNTTKKIVKIGDPLTPEESVDDVPQIEGATAVFPIRDDGTEMNWGVTGNTLQKLLDDGVVRVSAVSGKQPYSFRYLSANYKKKVEEGKWAVRGTREDGTKIVVNKEGKVTRATTVWTDKTNDAGRYGTKMLGNIIGKGKFNYSKSLYAVRDTLQYFVADKPNALILDFFAGSGTTLHAVNLLNAEDGGHRRCILVTNNEMSGDEESALKEQGLHPGDSDWEKYGIARYVTWPRTVCSIEGRDINGKELEDDYLAQYPDGEDIAMKDGFKANAVFFKLGFLDKNEVELGRQFRELLPLLWMKAGCHGRCPSLNDDILPDMLILPENRLAVLIDEEKYSKFREKISDMPKIDTVFFVTDSDSNYHRMISCFKDKDTYQLYRDYLDNFRINTGR